MKPPPGPKHDTPRGETQGQREPPDHRRRSRTGLVLMVVGAAFALRQLGASGLVFELVWLGAIFAAAAWTWRVVERRGSSRPRKTRDRTLLLLLGAFGLFALFTLDRLAGPALLATVALYFWLLYSSPSVKRGRATGFAIVAGAVTTIALVAGVDEMFPRWDPGAIFFLGMTATFTYSLGMT